MKNKLQRFFGLVLAVCITLPVLPVFTVNAAEKFYGWTVTEGNAKSTAVMNETTGGNTVIIKTDGSVTLSTQVDVKSGTKYRFGLRAKGTKVGAASISFGGSSNSLIAIANTFENWTNYEFEVVYTGADGLAPLSLSVSGVTESLEVDSFFVKEAESEENLVINPGFETFEEESEETLQGVGSLEGKNNDQIYESILNADFFSVSDLEMVLGGLKNIPVQRMENINIDGSGNEWEGVTPLTIPTFSSQVNKTLSEIGYSASVKVAYDDEYFYFYSEAYDAVHNYLSGDNCWMEDSVQFCLSRMNDGYGAEISIMYDEEKDESNIYSTSLERTEIMTMNFKGSRDNEKKITAYEMAIPWTIYYGAKPDDMKFNIIWNNDDGQGRAFLETAPGICTSKDSTEFPRMMLMDESSDWFGWIEGNNAPVMSSENEYSLMIINYGDEKEIKVSCDGVEETVTIPAHSGIRRVYKKTYEDSGSYIFSAKAECGGQIKEFTYDIAVQPSIKKAQDSVVRFTNCVNELRSLIKKCNDEGITTDYEDVYVTIIERFITYIGYDIECGDLSRIDYTIERLDRIYNKAKDNLNAYLSGEKESLAVPKYITGDTDVDGLTFVGDTETDGVIERRPVFMIGYLLFTSEQNEIPNMPAFGVNYVQREIGPNKMMRVSKYVPGFAMRFQNGFLADWAVTDKESQSGSKSIVVSGKSAKASSKYTDMLQEYDVKPNTTYEYGVSAKVTNKNGGAWFTGNGWDPRVYVSQNDGNWHEYTGTFTTGPEQTYAVFRFAVQDLCENLYIDDIYVREAGTTENLLKNGDIEKDYGEDGIKRWNIFKTDAEYIINFMKDCTENNIGVDMLLSPHYTLNELGEFYPDLQPEGVAGWVTTALDHPIYLEYLEDYLRTIVPMIIKQKSLRAICIANEPSLQMYKMVEYYTPAWIKHLKEKYLDDIEILNAAWESNYTSFEEINMPISPENTQRFCDYEELVNEKNADWFKYMINIVKEYTDIPVHIKNQVSFGMTDSEPVAPRMKLMSGQAPEPQMEFTDFNGNDYFLFPNYTMQGTQGVYGSSMFYDYMTSMNYAPSANTEDHVIYNSYPVFDDFTDDFSGTQMWQGAIHGKTVSTLWYWHRETVPNYTTHSYGLFLYRPEAMMKVSDATYDLNRNAYEVKAVQEEKRDVAILYTKSSRNLQSGFMNASYKAYEALQNNGKHVWILNDNEIGKLADCDALVIPNALHVEKETLDAILAFAESGGKILMIGEDSLKYTEKEFEQQDADKVNRVKALQTIVPAVENGIYTVEPSAENLHEIVDDFLTENRLKFVNLVDAETGETVTNVEWLSGFYDGKLIVNICNYAIDTPKKIKVVVNGETVTESTELREMKQLGEVIDLEPYSPILLQIENQPVFFDMYGHWAFDNVMNLHEKKIVNGVSDTRYAPEKSVTRAEFLTLVMRAASLKGVSYDGSINDVAKDSWYAQNIAYANKNSILDGFIENGNVFPDKPITREEMCAILVRIKELQIRQKMTKSEITLPDADSVSEWCREYAEAAFASGWILGKDGAFAPSDLSTRAEAATVISRFLG